MAGVKRQRGHAVKTSFKKGDKAAKGTKQKGKKKLGRPPKPKDPTFLQWIYTQIDKRIEKDVFKVFDNILAKGKKKGATVKEQEMAMRIAQDLLDRRLPKEQSQGMPRTIIIKNNVPYPGGNQESEVVITTGN